MTCYVLVSGPDHVTCNMQTETGKAPSNLAPLSHPLDDDLCHARCGRLALVAAAIACAAWRLAASCRLRAIAACAKENCAACIILRRLCYSHRK
jgi:hypothetical protein